MTIAINKLGRLTRFNGVDIEQTQHYIKLYNRTYIEKILRNHQWLNNEMPTSKFPTPMSSESKYQRELENAKPLTDLEQAKLEKGIGIYIQSRSWRDCVRSRYLLSRCIFCDNQALSILCKTSSYAFRRTERHIPLSQGHQGRWNLLLEINAKNGFVYWKSTSM